MNKNKSRRSCEKVSGLCIAHLKRLVVCSIVVGVLLNNEASRAKKVNADESIFSTTGIEPVTN